MIFAEPLWLFALLAVPLVPLLQVLGQRRDAERTARLVARPLWPRVLLGTDARRRLLPLALLPLGAAGLVLALARPQWGIVREKLEREGADVVLVLDCSGSMATPDVPPSRFFLARAALEGLLRRLEGDRFGLVAFEGDAYPLVPLTLDADAIGLFLETVEPGLVPAPGSSLGRGLARGLELFVDRERRNKVMVLLSDGEDLEGEIEPAVRKAKAAGVVVHTVGVGTSKGEPVPSFDAEGRPAGFKKDEKGQVVVSHLNEATLEAVARGTGGRYFRLAPTDPSLSALAAAIEALEEKGVAREFSYRRKERFQLPLGLGLLFFALALLRPLPGTAAPRAKGAARAAAGLVLALTAAPVLEAQAPSPSPAATPVPASKAREAGPRLLDEVLLRPRRLTEAGRRDYEQGNHPRSLEAFERAAATRPAEAATRFNLADGLYKNGRLDAAEALYRGLGADPASPLAPSARFNLGNTLYEKQDFAGAAQAYRDTLRLRPDDDDARRNLELALRALKQQQQRQQPSQDQPEKQPQNQRDRKEQKAPSDSKPPGAPRPAGSPSPKTAEEKEQQRFQQEMGMPKERAMQLLDALQRNEQAQQRKLLLAKRKEKAGKDW